MTEKKTTKLTSFDDICRRCIKVSNCFTKLNNTPGRQTFSVPFHLLVFLGNWERKAISILFFLRFGKTMVFKNNTNNFVFMLLSHDMSQRCWRPLITMSNMYCTHHQKTWNLYHHIPVSSFSSLCIANRRRPKTNPYLIPSIAVNVFERQVP